MIGTPIAEAFTDITDNYRYSKAINYLADHGIINGYPDDTYRPDTSVSRVEFLKLVMESSNVVPEDFGTSGFLDIDESAWYAPYVRKAKNEGWIEGYEGNLFKPEQKINKVEGLKIVAEIQNWSQTTTDILPYKDLHTTDWYAWFVTYANSKNFLEESTYFIPDEILSRGRIADILYRIHITNANNADAYSTKLKDVSDTNTEEPTSSTIPMPTFSAPPQLDFTPEDFSSASKNFFTDVTLNAELPNNFYLNEIYSIEGTINQGTYTKAFIFLAEEGNTDSSQFIDYVGAVENNKFSIPVIFRKPGNYQLGLILGNQGESKVLKISVLPSLPKIPTTLNKHKPLKTSIAYTNGQTTVKWDNNDNDIIRVNIYQGKTTKSYFIRQKKVKLDVAYEDFNGFKEGTTYLQIDGATADTTEPLNFTSQWAHGEPIQFSATQHQFSTIEKNDITTNGLKDFMTTVSTIEINGTTKKDIYQEAIITKPDGTVTENNLTSSKTTQVYFGSEIVPADSDFTFRYTPTTPGTYIVELNGKDGSAVINTPIYVKTGIPLTPDYFDIHKTNEQEKNFDLASDRNSLLGLINSERKTYGLSIVEIDASLNNLAQLHSEDMAKNNYFSHISLDGKSPNDRRIELSIPTAVGENLAQAPNIYYGHYGLMRSGIHRRNLLDPKWTRVGLGIAKDENGQLLITQEFSTYPLTSIDLAKIKTDYIDQINDYRSDTKNIIEFSIDPELADIAQDWSDKMADENFFDFNSPNGESLTSIVQKTIKGKAVQALILESSDPDKLIEEIIKTDEVNQSQWTKIGIGLKADNIGDLKATLLFTNH
ncbi:S-layer homology domain-containing protein [Candidatus Peregrinibacteria bacterium]|nr:S-layer homology domain-containing protein [Candidatus Peregrinibacteria bacterium]